MGHNITLNGVEGQLRHGYHAAGTLGAWSVSRTESGAWALTAAVGTLNAFRVSQRPIAFVATHATGVWRWPVIELQIEGASLSATLGPMER